MRLIRYAMTLLTALLLLGLILTACQRNADTRTDDPATRVQVDTTAAGTTAPQYDSARSYGSFDEDTTQRARTPGVRDTTGKQIPK